jgi:hypothetical protein
LRGIPISIFRHWPMTLSTKSKVAIDVESYVDIASSIPNSIY